MEFFRTPNVYGYINMSYKNAQWVNGELSGEYTGPMKAPHYAGSIERDRLETTSSFGVMNIEVHKSLSVSGSCTASLFVGVYNILNAYQNDLDKGVNRDSGYVYGPAKPRSIYGGIEFSF